MRAKVVVLSLVIGVLACATAWAASPKEVLLGNFDPMARPVATVKAPGSKFSTHEPAHLLPRALQANRAEESRETVNLVLDDGLINSNIGYGGTGSDHFMWFNIFTPAPTSFPFSLDQVQVWFDSTQAAVGDSFRAVVLEDLTGGDPSDATILHEETFTVGTLDGWNLLNLSTPALCNGPGNVLIGIAQDFNSAYPAAGDNTAYKSASWIADWSADCVNGPFVVPIPLVWSGFCTLSLITDLAPSLTYNWMVRGVGSFPSPVVDAGSPTFIADCPYGGIPDAFADPGETVTYFVDITNNGTQDATGVTSVLSSTFPGLNITQDTASIGSLAQGASTTGSFEFTVPISAHCGDLIPLMVTSTFAERPYATVSNLNLRVGDFTLGPTVNILMEDFETWPLTGWTIDADPSGMTWYQGSLGYWANFEGTGDFAGIDAWQYLPYTGTSSLLTPTFDIAGGYETANLYYKTAYYDYYGASSSYLDISTDGGTSWSHLQTFWDELFTGILGPQNVDLSSYIGVSGLQLRFLANSPMYYTIWQVDDLALTAKYADICFSTTCIPPFAIDIITPYDQQDLYGMTQICATVTDDSIVDFVTWSVNGVPLAGCENLTTLPYCCIFDPQMYAKGMAHTLTATATLVDGSTYSSTIHFYVVGAVTADPDAWPPSGLAPLPVRFLANAKSGSGKYLYSWWKSSVTNAAMGEWMMDSHGDKVFTNPSLDYTFGTVGDYLVTLFVTDYMGTDDPTDDVVFMALPVKITVTQLATPDTDTDNIQKTSAASL